jgi:hypothetical protein
VAGNRGWPESGYPTLMSDMMNDFFLVVARKKGTTRYEEVVDGENTWKKLVLACLVSLPRYAGKIEGKEV